MTYLVNKRYQFNTGKTALSFENAAKNIPLEVVKLRSKNSSGAAGQMVRTGVM